MKKMFHYGSVSEAINNYRQQGFIIDFNLKENCISCNGDDKFKAEDFEIIDLYRYEGNSDPADEATVYAIQSKSGLKGILVTGYGIYSDSDAAKTLSKLHYQK
jgi:hypothetical protein